MFGGSRNVVTGLDIGSESIKAVRLAHTGTSVKLLGIAVGEIEYPTASRSDTDAGANNARVEAIRRVLRAAGADVSRACRIVTAVEGPSVSVKHVTFPKMPGPSLAESIGWEAKKHVPFGASEFVLDFQELDRPETEADDEMHVLLAAVEQRLIDRHIGLAVEAGIEPYTVDIVPLAVMNEITEAGLLNDGAVAAIEMGCSTMSVAIYRRGGLLLARSVRMPIHAAGRAGAGVQGVADDAEAAGPEGGGAAGFQESEERRRLWQNFALKEAQRSLQFYNTETGRRGIEKIYLAGGRALAPGIADAFSNALKTKTEVYNPLARFSSTAVDIEPIKEQGPKFTLAMGLARRA